MKATFAEALLCEVVLACNSSTKPTIVKPYIAAVCKVPYTLCLLGPSWLFSYVMMQAAMQMKYDCISICNMHGILCAASGCLYKLQLVLDNAPALVARGGGVLGYAISRSSGLVLLCHR
jgi:hypothetical protein